MGTQLSGEQLSTPHMRYDDDMQVSRSLIRINSEQQNAQGRHSFNCQSGELHVS